MAEVAWNEAPLDDLAKPWDEAHAAAAKRLRLLRNRAGLSRWQLAKASHVCQKVIAACELSEQRITVRNALRLAPPLNCTPAYLLFGI